MGGAGLYHLTVVTKIRCSHSREGAEEGSLAMETVHCGVLEFQEVQRLYAGGQSGIRY